MLILTVSALNTLSQFPAWDGVRVLVRTIPEYGRQANSAALPEDPVVVEYLQPFESVTQVICDLMLWLSPRLLENTSPLLFINRPTNQPEILNLLDRGCIAPRAFITEFDETGRLLVLVLGQKIAQSPLLAEVFDFIRAHSPLDDHAMIELLDEAFNWTQ